MTRDELIARVREMEQETTRLAGLLEMERAGFRAENAAGAAARAENTRLMEKCGAFKSQLQFLARRLENESQKVRDQDRNLPKRARAEHIILIAEWELLDRLQDEVLRAIPEDDFAASDNAPFRQPDWPGSWE